MSDPATHDSASSEPDARDSADTGAGPDARSEGEHDNPQDDETVAESGPSLTTGLDPALGEAMGMDPDAVAQAD